MNIINTMPVHNFFNLYNRYVFLNPKKFIYSSFFDIEYHNYDFVGIRSYSSVGLNFRISNSTNNYVWSLSTKAIQYCVDKTH